MNDVAEPASRLSPLKQALLALDGMQTKLDAMEQAKTEPIAIIGMGCRFPGGAKDPDSFWQLLRDGVDAITEIPPDRWDVDAFYDPDPEALGKMYTRYGGFLDEIDKFDAQFFGISPREAVSLDPQQRLLLEVSWEALENAGHAPDELAGSQTGVFVGVMENDYSKLHVKTGDSADIDAYYVTGTELNFAAGRVSYLLGLHGPSLAVDTACSSSLVAVHLACQSLRSGESDLALAGGVNLLLSPELTISMCKFRALSIEGRCKTFDAAADGFVQGEGCGIVVLKRFSDAVADGDNILALIRGSAINHDGPSSGLTVPNGLAQQALIRQALANAGVPPDQVGYVETHGTGTILGDPIEVRALGAVLSAGRSENQPLTIGSVKTNLGHLESAAGIASLIKVVLCMQHEEIPPHLHFKVLNPHISLEEFPVTIPTQRRPWLGRGQPRIAGVSSFGLSGTNSHLVVEEGRATQPTQPTAERPIHLLALSAKDESALEQLAGRFEKHFESHPEEALADICFTANTGRSHFGHRLAQVVESSSQVCSALAALSARTEPAGMMRGCIKGTEQPEVAFLFTGQGAQYEGMGRQLYEAQPTFRRTLETCDELLRSHLENPLLSVLYPQPGSDSLLDETAYTQPALFALEYALAELWQSWGIKPAVVMGHSVGEYVAACVAGVFSLEDGLKLIAERGRLMQILPKDGTMAVVFAAEDSVREAMAPFEELVSVAAVNGPMNVVISGESNAVRAVLDLFQAEGVKTQPLNVSHAFHSPLMEPILDAFEQAASQLQFSVPRVPLLSNVTGRIFGNDEIPDAAYWRRHIRETVRFSDSVRTLHEQGCNLLLELGPSPVLLGMGRRCVPDSGTAGVWLPSLRRNRDDWQQMLESLSAAYVQGVDVDWTGFDRDYACGRRRVALPTYPFQRERYWLQPSREGFAGLRRADSSHPLLGRRLRSPLQEALFESQLRCDWPPILADHQIWGMTILPGTAYLEMALSAAAEALGSGPHVLKDVLFREALVLSEHDALTVQLILTPEGAGEASFQVYSLHDSTERVDTSWTLHASGRICAADSAPEHDQISKEEILARCSTELSVEEYYHRLLKSGLQYGPSFQGIEQLWLGEGEVLGRIGLPNALLSGDRTYRVHPALIDAGLQTFLAILHTSEEQSFGDENFLPIELGRFQVYGPVESQLWSYARIRPGDDPQQESAVGDLFLINDAGQTVVAIRDQVFKRTRRTAFQSVSERHLQDWLYQVRWIPQDRQAIAEALPPDRPGVWLVLSDKNGVGFELAKSLEERGEQCVLAFPGESLEFSKEGHWLLNPQQPEEFEMLLRSIPTANEEPLRGVIHLWSLAASQSREVTAASLATAQTLGCRSILHLVQALAKSRRTRESRLWLVTRGTQPAGLPHTPLAVAQSPVWGLGRVITNEHPGFQCVQVDLDPSGQADEGQVLFSEIWTVGKENQIALRQSGRYVPRLVRGTSDFEKPQAILQVPGSECYQLEIPVPGILDNMVLQPATRRPVGPGEVEIQVLAAGLNFRDVLSALGMYPGEAGSLGRECAGRIVALGEKVEGFDIGDEVIALAPGSFATYVTTRAELVVHKPDHLSFEEAATIPVTFLTAFFGLHHLARVSAGDRVLIHAAAGGVGTAAVQLAQRAGAQVYATASPGKWGYLQSLGVQYVMNSRTLDFSREIMKYTEGQGVDIVLNSLADGYIPESLSVLGTNGRFLEIGKRGIWEASQVAEIRPDVSYYVYDLSDLIQTSPAHIRSMLYALLEAFADGGLRPLPQRVFPMQQAVSAFHNMAQAKHVGKIVLSNQQQGYSPSPSRSSSIRSDGTYLITGGLSGLGLEAAQWLVEQGSRHLVLVGRNAPSEHTREILKELEQTGAQVAVAQADVSQENQVARVLDDICGLMPPLRGIIHSAGIVDDGVLLQQTWERFGKAMAPKLAGAWNLHSLTRHIWLDFFVLFSSTASLLGPLGQGNYAAANAFLDGLAYHRRALGLPALSINWGPWGEVGMVTALSNQDRQRLLDQGMQLILPSHGMQALERLLAHASPQAVVVPIDWAKYCQHNAAASELPFLTQVTEEAEHQPETEGGLDLVPKMLLEAEPAERQRLVESAICEIVARVLRLPVGSVDVERPLSDLGLDSLMAIELFNRIERAFGKTIHMETKAQAPTVAQLSRRLYG